jgi:hypothetical protein
MGSSKNSSQFSRDEQVLKIWVFRGFPRFLGDQKHSRNADFLQFLGILKDELVQNFSELRLLRSFLGILEGLTQVSPE